MLKAFLGQVSKNYMRLLMFGGQKHTTMGRNSVLCGIIGVVWKAGMASPKLLLKNGFSQFLHSIWLLNKTKEMFIRCNILGHFVKIGNRWSSFYIINTAIFFTSEWSFFTSSYRHSYQGDGETQRQAWVPQAPKCLGSHIGVSEAASLWGGERGGWREQVPIISSMWILVGLWLRLR